VTQGPPVGTIWCPTCGSQNYPGAKICWMCRFQIPEGSTTPPANGGAMRAPAPGGEAAGNRSWAGGSTQAAPQPAGGGAPWPVFTAAILVSLVLVSLFLEAIYLYNGVGVLSIFVVAPVIGFLLRVTWPRNAGGAQKAVAVAFGVLFGIAAVILFLILVAGVLVWIICSSSGSFH
jgi:hypothetical protein